MEVFALQPPRNSTDTTNEKTLVRWAQAPGRIAVCDPDRILRVRRENGRRLIPKHLDFQDTLGGKNLDEIHLFAPGYLHALDWNPFIDLICSNPAPRCATFVRHLFTQRGENAWVEAEREILTAMLLRLIEQDKIHNENLWAFQFSPQKQLYELASASIIFQHASPREKAQHIFNIQEWTDSFTSLPKGLYCYDSPSFRYLFSTSQKPLFMLARPGHDGGRWTAPLVEAAFGLATDFPGKLPAQGCIISTCPDPAALKARKN